MLYFCGGIIPFYNQHHNFSHCVPSGELICNLSEHNKWPWLTSQMLEILPRCLGNIRLQINQITWGRKRLFKHNFWVLNFWGWCTNLYQPPCSAVMAEIDVPLQRHPFLFVPNCVRSKYFNYWNFESYYMKATGKGNFSLSKNKILIGFLL